MTVVGDARTVAGDGPPGDGAPADPEPADPEPADTELADTELADWRSADRRLQALVENSTDLLIVGDLDSREVSYAASSTADLLGYPRSSLAGIMMRDLIHEDDHDATRAATAEAVASRRPARFRARLVRSDGALRWFDCVVSDQRDEPAVGGIVFNGRDITDQVTIEEALRQRATINRAIADLSRLVLEGLVFDELAAAVVERACGTVGVECGAVMRCDGPHFLQPIAGHGWPAVAGDIRVPTGPEFPSGRALASGRPVRVDDVLASDLQIAPVVIAAGLRSVLAAPIADADAGGHFGVLVLQGRSPRAFSEDDVHFIDAVAGILSIARSRDAALSEMARQAVHDQLTGLANEALFTELLGRVQGPAAVVALSLDRFKAVNETSGRDAGDSVLVEMARRLASLGVGADVLARLGGDEFCFLLTGENVETRAASMGRRIVDLAAVPFDHEGREIRLTASVGIAVRDVADDGILLLRDAQAAQHRAKELGGGRSDVFDAGLRDRVAKRLIVEDGLAHVLERDELVLHFQPVVSLETGDIHGFEALVRWNHPVRGMIAPLEWIPIAEASGHITDIGSWVLVEALQRLSAWRAASGLYDLHVAVNLSPKQLANRWFVKHVRYALDRAELPGDALVLELTEGVVMAEPDRAVAVLSDLRAEGVRVAIDDFGTGYSSLSYLTRLPVDVLKIDRTFVQGVPRNHNDATVARLIADLARGLRLGIIAEGVEEHGQAAALLRMGCDLAQGYLMSRPVPADDVLELLGRQPFWWTNRLA